MKNIKLFLFAFVAMTMVFAGCKKENENEGNSSTQNMPESYMSYAGHVYELEGFASIFHSNLTLAGALSKDTLDNGDPVIRIDGIHISPDVWGRTLDLTNPDSWVDGIVMDFIIEGTVIDLVYHGWFNGDTGIGGRIDGVEYENQSIFKNGTLLVEGNNDGSPITVTLKGELKNDKTLNIKFIVPTENQGGRQYL